MGRILEFTTALILIILLAPLALLISALILITMGRPVLFKQKRPGLKAKPFTIYKFRTMTNKPLDIDQIENVASSEARLTWLGRWLRKFSLDELPQFYNILRGDLAFVGPRPFLVGHLKLYTPEQMRRHDVKPGMTGWAQINGRNSVKWEDKLKLDLWYVDNKSVWLDLKIMLITLVVVIGARDVEYQSDPPGVSNE